MWVRTTEAALYPCRTYAQQFVRDISHRIFQSRVRRDIETTCPQLPVYLLSTWKLYELDVFTIFCPQIMKIALKFFPMGQFSPFLVIEKLFNIVANCKIVVIQTYWF